MVAKPTAAAAKIVTRVLDAPCPASARAPTIEIPEIALDPDINGVWSCDGTLVMSSIPRNIASTKMKNRN